MHQHLELATGHELRPSSPDDAPRLVAMFERCSPASRATRGSSPRCSTSRPRTWSTSCGRRAIRRSWVVDDLDTGQLVAVGSWFRNQLFTAEVGLLVEDAAQRQGIGTELLDTIADDALAAGITALVATTLAESRHVYRMFGRLGPTTIACAGPTCDLRVDLSPE